MPETTIGTVIQMLALLWTAGFEVFVVLFAPINFGGR